MYVRSDEYLQGLPESLVHDAPSNRAAARSRVDPQRELAGVGAVAVDHDGYTCSPLRKIAPPLATVAVVAMASVGALANPASGERGYTIEWQAADACPDGDVTRAAIDRLLVDAPERDGPPVDARGRIEATANGYRLVLEFGDTQREIEGPDCEELTQTAALIVAMAVDPRVLARVDLRVPVAPEPAAEPTATPTEDPLPRAEVVVETTASRTTATPATAATPLRPPEPQRPGAFGFSGAFAVGLDLGTLPAATAHVGGSLSAAATGRQALQGAFGRNR